MWSVVAALMVAMFTITLGYGVVLPILPFTIEDLIGGADPAALSRVTGFVTGTYTLAVFLFAPLWGRLSDRIGRRPVMLIGLIGFAVTLALFGLIGRLPLLYLTRFFNGACAAAVTPAAYALIGDLGLSRAARAHRFALLNIAATAGFLAGPLFGGLLLRGTNLLSPWLPMPGVPAPFLVTAGFAVLVIPLIWCLLPHPGGRKAAGAPADPGQVHSVTRLRLLAVALVTAAAVGAFEVGLSLRGKQVLGLDAYRIGMMFTECSLVMFVVQAMVFSPLLKPEATRWLLVPSLAVLSVGLIAVPFANSYLSMVLAVGSVAASAGILSPIVTYWISLVSPEREGTELGLQTAAASLGQALGSAIGGLLFEVRILPGGSFVAPAALVLAGLAAALGLPEHLTSLLCAKPTSVPCAKRAKAPEGS
jgi:MFS family permease